MLGVRLAQAANLNANENRSGLRMHAADKRAVAGFTLLEVMVALAILGAVLVTVLSAQGGLAASNASGRNLAAATNLGRCKMTELEEFLYTKGFSVADEHETDRPCCADKDNAKFHCAWNVERVELPQLPAPDAGAALVGAGGSSGAPGGALGALAGLASGGADGGIPDISKVLSGGDPSGSGGGIVEMVMGMVYPSLKPALERAIRKVTVKVEWQEGQKPKSFELVQYVTDVRGTGFMPGQDGDGGVPPPSGRDGGI